MLLGCTQALHGSTQHAQHSTACIPSSLDACVELAKSLHCSAHLVLATVVLGGLGSLGSAGLVGVGVLHQLAVAGLRLLGACLSLAQGVALVVHAQLGLLDGPAQAALVSASAQGSSTQVLDHLSVGLDQLAPLA